MTEGHVRPSTMTNPCLDWNSIHRFGLFDMYSHHFAIMINIPGSMSRHVSICSCGLMVHVRFTTVSTVVKDSFSLCHLPDSKSQLVWASYSPNWLDLRSGDGLTHKQPVQVARSSAVGSVTSNTSSLIILLNMGIENKRRGSSSCLQQPYRKGC